MSISTVAKLAGVSTSTVSRVINNHPRRCAGNGAIRSQSNAGTGLYPIRPAAGSEIGGADQSREKETGCVPGAGHVGQQATPAFAGLAAWCFTRWSG